MFNSIDDFFRWGDGIFLSILIALLITALFWVLASLCYRKIFPTLVRHISEKKHPVASHLLQGFRRPAAMLLRTVGLCVGLIVLCGRLQYEWLPATLLRLTAALPPILTQAVRIAIVLAATWGLVASSDIFSIVLGNARNKLDINMSKSVSRFLAAVFNVVVVAIAAVILLKEFNYDINGLIAGLGLGGLTVALAAKDSASNFFGGLVLVTEKPFEIGDWINCGEVEGTVEDINLRSTKVRTITGALTVVPNAMLSSNAITNSTIMEKRRADFTLQLVYSTTKQQVAHFVQTLGTLLKDDPDILADTVTVRFFEFGESSLNVRVIFYTALPAFGDHLAIRERVNLAIMALAQEQGITFAYPTRTLYTEGGKPPA